MADLPNPFDGGYYESEELRRFGFRQVGEDVRVARNCTIVGVGNISLGNHVRIDDHVTILAHTGFFTAGDYLHLGGGSYLGCAAGVTMGDFSGLSQGVKIYSASDDYTGRTLTNPTVPVEYRAVTSGPVTLGRHVIVGSGSVILPGVTLGEGAAVGALSMVTKSLGEWSVYFGAPARRVKARSRRLLELEAKLRAAHG